MRGRAPPVPAGLGPGRGLEGVLRSSVTPVVGYRDGAGPRDAAQYPASPATGDPWTGRPCRVWDRDV